MKSICVWDSMTEKDIQLGVIIVVFATFFFLSGIDVLRIEVFDKGFSMFLAFILIAVGVYLIAKK